MGEHDITIFQICDKLKHPTIMAIVGNVSMALGYFFLGPPTFLSVETKLSLIQGMVGLISIGDALVTTSSFGRAQRAARKLGYADDINTYTMISSKATLVE